MGYCGRRLSVCAKVTAILVSIVSYVALPKTAFTASATLYWTAPGDDGAAGRASLYAVRFSSNPIPGTDTLSWWITASMWNMSGKVPAASGTLDSTVISGLVSGRRYYMIIRTADEVPNWSRFSNVVAVDAADSAPLVVGTVRDASTGLAIGGAVVRETGSGAAVTSNADGTYTLSVAAGTRTFTASMYSYNTVTSSVVAVAGATKTLNFTLPRTPTGTLSGTATRATDSSVLSGGEVTLPGTPLAGTTGADGKYALTVPQGTVTVRFERAGFKPQTQSVTITAGQTKALNFAATPVTYYDDAQTDMGWSLSAVGDDATTGNWIRAVPIGTMEGLTQVQASTDHTPGAGTMCFVTGNGIGTDTGEADVDGGRTTLTSPVLRLSGMPDPRIVYWRWYSNDAGENPGEDPFITQISNNGGPWITVSMLYATRNYWERMEIPVTRYFSQPGNVQVRFIAEDLANRSIVEAAIDDLEYYSGPLLGVPHATARGEETPAPALVIGVPRPSPSRGPTEVNLELPKATSVTADVFNVQGRLVRTLERRVLPAGRHVLRWDGRLDQGGNAASGVYWLRLGVGEVERRLKLVVVR